MYPSETIQVVHGPSQMSFDNLNNESVGTARASLRTAFNIPDEALSSVNGNRVGLAHRLEVGDILEFLTTIGRKGLGKLLSPTQVMEAWGIDMKQYDAWIAEGLPTENLVDGSTAHFEAAVDEWCRGRVRVKPSKNPPAMKSKWLRLKDAAGLVGVSARQLSRYADQGKIAHRRKAGRGRGGRGEYLFLPEEVEKFITRTTVPARFGGNVPPPRQPALKTKTYIDPKTCGRILPK